MFFIMICIPVSINLKRKRMSHKKASGERWVKSVTTEWHPQTDFFKGSASSIAEGLFESSDSLAQAMDRLDFYVNRAGKELSVVDKERLESVKPLLRSLFGE